jgi:hypothetical protein
VIRFLSGAAFGAFAAAYLLSWWLSATPEGEASVTYTYSTN